MQPVEVERFYLGCLAHASYLVSSGGVAAVIDPQRDVDIYLEATARHGVRIHYVIETHLHADFVSGHQELASRTGARIYIGKASGATFDHVGVEDGDVIQFGDCRLDFLTTPGHTVESICVVMTDLGQPHRPKTVFTGDTLFIGDVGRPDLSPVHTPQQLAALLYRSLHEKLLALPDDTEIFPAHGAGSLCGRQMSADASSTIGKERRTNYALQARSSEEFVHLLTDTLPPRPEYFVREVEMNRTGAAALEQLPSLRPIPVAQVQALQSEGVVVVDTRPAMQFAVAHVPGAIHIALTGQYASWAARIIGLDTRIIICGEDADHVRESQLRLARVGIENVVGFIEDGIIGWITSGGTPDYIPQVAAEELAGLMEDERGKVTILDVREPLEAESGVIAGSVRIPLGELPAKLDQLRRDGMVVVHCKSGFRSSIATSLLRRAGFHDVANLTGGFEAWKAAGLPHRPPHADDARLAASADAGAQ